MNAPADRHEPAIDEGGEPPLLRVVKGDPTPEELAALVAVVTTRRGGADEPPRRRPIWGRPAAAMRRPHRAGPGAWRGSSLPR
jgi:hypothetical protein